MITSKLQQIAANQDLKKELEILLKGKPLTMLLDALIEENNASLVISAPQGADIVTVIALEAAKRAGAQEVIRKIRTSPYLTGKRLIDSVKLGKPWDYLGNEESQSTESPKPAKKNP